MGKKASMTDEVYERIKADITENRPARNVLLTEQMLADAYGTSRTPVREALARLCFEGYIVKYPKKGYLIQSTDRDLKIKETIQLRYFVELGVVWELIQNASDEQIRACGAINLGDNINREAIVKYNTEFHINLARATGNTEAINLISDLADKSGDHLVLMGQKQQYVSEMESCHEKIINALLERDFAKAAIALHDDYMPVVTQS